MRSLIFLSFFSPSPPAPILNAFICSWLRQSPASRVILARFLLLVEVVKRTVSSLTNHSFLFPSVSFRERKKNPLTDIPPSSFVSLSIQSHSRHGLSSLFPFFFCPCLWYRYGYFLLFLFYARKTPRTNSKPIVLFFTRSRWLPLLPVPEVIYHRLPSSFTGDLEAGLSSSQFDIAANVADGDARAGLDDAGKLEVKKIMKSERVGFDEARRLYTQRRFAKNNIGPDGRPRDPKFVSFS